MTTIDEQKAGSVKSVAFESAATVPPRPNGTNVLTQRLDLIQNVKLKLSVYIGEAQLSVGELFALKEDGVITLDRETTAPVDVTFEGNVIARGHLVAVDDHFGVQIVEMIKTV